MSNIEYKPAEKLEVQLSRPASNISWGFRLQGGVDFSTPLSIQSVNPNSVSERCGLKPGDAILAINRSTSDAMTHDDAKEEIMRSGNHIVMLVERGAVKIWKPQVTPLSELRPQELRTITSATGEDITPVQKTSLAINKLPDAPCNIGSSHNRSAQPFGKPKAAVPNVVHSQYNSPMGLYSAGNIADTYAKQTVGIQSQMQNMDLNESPLGTVISGSGQVLEKELPIAGPAGRTIPNPPEDLHVACVPTLLDANPSTDEGTIPWQASQSLTFKKVQERLEVETEACNNNNISGFKSVSAPIAKPPNERPQQPSMRCGVCDMLATGVIVKANGVPYHVACFKCVSCSMNLKQKGFFVVDGKLYCETHAKRHAKPPGPGMLPMASYR